MIGLVENIIKSIPMLTNGNIYSGGSRISPRRGRQLPGGVANIRICKIFPKTAWNWKNFGPQGEARVPRTPS